MHIILASASPRRKELLGYLGVEFTVVVPDIHEHARGDESPEDFCRRISLEKARFVKKSNPDSLVVAADTIVVIDRQVLGKPKDADEACIFLRLLKARSHTVYTAYTIIPPGISREMTRVVNTIVHFADMSDEDIRWYVSTGEPVDKAGAYGLQGIGAAFVERIEGSYTNVIGLPLSEVFGDIKRYIRPDLSNIRRF